MKLFCLLTLSFLLASCGGKKNDTDGTEVTETAQQVGDIMASVDEVGGASGNIARLENSIQQTFARHAPNELKEYSLAKFILPQAKAVSCNGYGFAACSSNSVTRNFNGCSVGTATFTGSVVTAWGGTSSGCVLMTVGDTISRSPSFTVEGRRGATLTVTKSGAIGQRLAWASGVSPKVFNYTNDGINRKFTSGVGNVVMDYTTTVTSPIVITGEMRSGRVMNGGSLQVKNNITNVTCSFAPVNVTWAPSTTCNCPTQGTWQGSCSDGKTTTLAINGCGTANYTEGTQTDPVTFDRCGT